MPKQPSHCRNCGMMFRLVEQSADMPNLCTTCRPLYATVQCVPEAYYCISCKRFCLVEDRAGQYSGYSSYSYSSYPYCYSCDTDFDD